MVNTVIPSFLGVRDGMFNTVIPSFLGVVGRVCNTVIPSCWVWEEECSTLLFPPAGCGRGESVQHCYSPSGCEERVFTLLFPPPSCPVWGLVTRLFDVECAQRCADCSSLMRERCTYWSVLLPTYGPGPCSSQC